MSRIRNAARRLGLGRLAFTLFHGPLGAVKQSIREGGPIEQWRTEKGRLEMVEAAGKLPPLTDPGNPLPVAATFLSGAKYWYQTLFCIVSLQQQIDRRIDVVIFDDGTFDDATRGAISRIVPWARFRSSEESMADLDRVLPESRYPSLRARRIVYPHLRKLTDLHCAAEDWTMVLDSDMLFFRRPDALLEWMTDRSAPIYLADVASAYGYSDALLAELAGHPVPQRVNVGLYTLEGRGIDWDELERWCREQIAREGPHYLQEQALVAMLLAGKQARQLPERDYIVMPSPDEGRAPRGILHHYVAETKGSYFRHGWREIARRAEGDRKA